MNSGLPTKQAVFVFYAALAPTLPTLLRHATYLSARHGGTYTAPSLPPPMRPTSVAMLKPGRAIQGVVMSTYQERMLEESAQLEDRLVKLQAFIRTDAYEGLEDVDQLLLRLQAGAMAQYAAALESRITRSR